MAHPRAGEAINVGMHGAALGGLAGFALPTLAGVRPEDAMRSGMMGAGAGGLLGAGVGLGRHAQREEDQQGY